MFEKVNPSHPDKVADRIAGALVDLAYSLQKDPKIAIEVLLGHGKCLIITESSVKLGQADVEKIVRRIAGPGYTTEFIHNGQDIHLSNNQNLGFRCGDNGIFRGMPVTEEQKELTRLADKLYSIFPSDGKYILDKGKIVICQSNAQEKDIRSLYPDAVINPLGPWTGGPEVDCGATNRKLGSDMGDSITGGGLHGKDLSKADVSINIYAFLKAQELKKPVELSCAIGDTVIDGRPYGEIVEIARDYVSKLGGFENFALWGLIRP